MKRRNFLSKVTLGGGAIISAPYIGLSNKANRTSKKSMSEISDVLRADAIVIGGGLGGFAATLSLLRNNKIVILTEETDWVGGQLTQQGVPPDEHKWIESTGATQMYRDFRKSVRDYYKQNYPLTGNALNNPYLNPGNGSVSRLCHEPRVALAVMNNMFAPYLSSGKLTLLLNHKALSATVIGDVVEEVFVENLVSLQIKKLVGEYFIDATELGDLLPLTGTEFVTGTESIKDTGELHAPEIANPENVQAFTFCFAMDYIAGEDHTIAKPADYHFWRNHIPDLKPNWSGKLLELKYSKPSTLEPKELGFHPEGKPTGKNLNLWKYRRIIDKEIFEPDAYSGDISIVNWPQNDYMLGNLVGASEKDFEKYIYQSKQLSLSLLYWLQTEVPRPDGGKGWPGIRLRKDIMGTEDGLAKYPYVRESRRIKAVFTILEEHVGKENRERVAKTDKNKAANFYDSVGIGYYHIDLHPTCENVNYVDFPSLPFQIPLGALLPIRMKNILPANKNIGTTHITNGCYRLHPVEWSIGEAVGLLIATTIDKQTTPHEVRANKEFLKDFQQFVRENGVEIEWRKL